MPPLSAESLGFRCLVLCFASLGTIGPNFAREAYNVLQTPLTRDSNCSSSSPSVLSATGGCCHDCLGLGDEAYNMLFTALFCSTTVGLLVFGFLMDRFGNSIIAVCIFVSFLGVCVFAVSSCVPDSPMFLVLIFTGISLQGFGYVPAVTARGRLLATWFSGGQLGVAFGVATASNRLASLLTFAITEPLRERVGLQKTLWAVAGITGVSVLCAVAASLLDAHGLRQLGREQAQQKTQKAVSLADLRHLGSEFWLLAACYTLFSSAYNTYQDNLSKYVHQRYAVPLQAAALMAGSVRYVGIIVAPVSGWVKDFLGMPGWLTLAGSCLLPPVILLQSLTDFNGLLCVLVFGTVCCFLYVVMESTVPLIVPAANVGMALSLQVSFTTAFLAILHAVEGTVLGWEVRLPLPEKLQRWRVFMLVLAATLAASVAFAVAMVTVAKSRASQLVQPRSRSAKYENLSEAAEGVEESSH